LFLEEAGKCEKNFDIIFCRAGFGNFGIIRICRSSDQCNIDIMRCIFYARRNGPFEMAGRRKPARLTRQWRCNTFEAGEIFNMWPARAGLCRSPKKVTRCR